jgi:hypothetical protein
MAMALFPRPGSGPRRRPRFSRRWSGSRAGHGFDQGSLPGLGGAVLAESGSVTNFTVFGEIPWADSSAATSKVPMLLTPFNPIFRPASWPGVVMREFPVTTSARVPGDKVEASARIRNRAPAA